MKTYEFYQNLSLIIVIILIVLVTLIALFWTLSVFSNKKSRSVVFPEFKEEKEKNSFLNLKLLRKNKEQGIKQKSSLKKKIINLLAKHDIDKKVKTFYIRAGHYDKTIENLFQDALKWLFIGTAMGCAIIFFLGNVLFGIAFGLFFASYPFIDLFGDIQDRQAAFRHDFPYFLQTLSFVLKNGSNMSVAFKEVTNKQSDGILKEVMQDVISSQKVNGGDFTQAFSSITEKIQIDETKEFVEIVQSSMEKGIPVAEIFTTQSATITRFIDNKRKKKIKSVSTKILVPILIVIVGVFLLFNVF